VLKEFYLEKGCNDITMIILAITLVSYGKVVTTMPISKTRKQVSGCLFHILTYGA